MRTIFGSFLLIFLLTELLVACGNSGDAEPLVMVVTPDAADAGFVTYAHKSGVFSIRIPPHWIPDELPDNNGIRVQFTSIEEEERVVRLTVYVINTGQPLTQDIFLQMVNTYQPPADVSAVPWKPVGDARAMIDGSVRLSGIRDYPMLGARAVNIFFQGNGSYLSILETDVTDINEGVLKALTAVINTYRVNTGVPLTVGQVLPVGAGVTSASGNIAFDHYLHWQDVNGGFNITGQLTNLSDYALEAVRLTAYLYDAEDTLLAERSDVLTYDVLAAHESAPFRIRFETGRPTNAIRYEVHAAARRAEYALADFYGSENFIIADDRASYNENGYLTISGIIQNNAGQLATSVRVIVSIFNEAGQVVATETAYINRDQLLPAEATDFEVVIYNLGGDAVRYTLVAQGLIGEFEN